jgi:putative hydrolase of the HAD superfamily
MSLFDVIAMDADDTLWHNEHIYRQGRIVLIRLLAQYGSPEAIYARLFQIETQNLVHFGYGLKSFTLSMIETAVEFSKGRISGDDIQELIEQNKKMVASEVELVDHVIETVSQLSTKYPLMLITKGDLFEQENKITRSGLGHFFKFIEVVSEKNSETYRHLLEHYSIEPRRFLMVGNSTRSDILPILELGGHAVYIPYPTTWQHENAELPPPNRAGYFKIENISLLPDLLRQLENSGMD